MAHSTARIHPPIPTKAQILAAPRLHSNIACNADGSCCELRNNGTVKTYKRDLARFTYPYKYGLYNYGYITQDNVADVHLPEDCPRKH